MMLFGEHCKLFVDVSTGIPFITCLKGCSVNNAISLNVGIEKEPDKGRWEAH